MRKGEQLSHEFMRNVKLLISSKKGSFVFNVEVEKVDWKKKISDKSIIY